MIKSNAFINCVAIVCFVAWLAGCATTDSPTGGQSKASKSGSGSIQHHLLTPESDEDLTVLSDAELETRIDAKDREVNQNMKEAGNYMIDNLESDLSRDRTYQQILRRVKQADTDLNRLMREADRRAAARAKAG